tara:strand:+ start:13391 stop:15193 length:1803 start_codon:yes stop_codon:yes gene_type:complete
VDGKVPQNYEELWQGFDPQKEPLDVEVLKEWEEDGVVLKVLRYRVGIFKGKKAMIAAVYGYPKGAKNLPGLVQIHGGGQYAHYKTALTNAKRGYATISISWAGRLSAPDYLVNPQVVKLFWENKTKDPQYKITTDWGALDGYHAPSRNGKNAFVSIITAPWTLDSVVSPRNNSWFLATMGARRALTFLEKQPEVDASKLGVYGHSMGGKLTVLTAGSDSRVKAAAPSCGGISDRYNKEPLHRNAVGDSPYLQHIACPTMFLSPANDFHGHINDLPQAVSELKTKHWRVACNAHLNHRDLPSGEVATQLWFDEHLKGTFKFPETPGSELQLKTADHIPFFSATPDDSKKIASVDIYYTQQGVEGGDRQLRLNRINRYWHHASADVNGKTWAAKLPVVDAEKALWVYANVHYELETPVSGVGYYYGDYTAKTFNLSSLVKLVKPGELKAAGVLATVKPSLVIEAFEGDWKKNFFQHQTKNWEYRTHKVYSPLWKAPVGGSICIDLLAEEANKCVIGIDGYAAEIKHAGGGVWKTITLSLSDFKDANNQALKSWDDIYELRLIAAEHLRSSKGKDRVTRLVGAGWKGKAPQFRNLRWIKPQGK